MLPSEQKAGMLIGYYVSNLLISGLLLSKTIYLFFFFSLPMETGEKEMATHSCVLAWEISWAEDPGGIQFMGSQRVGHD